MSTTLRFNPYEVSKDLELNVTGFTVGEAGEAAEFPLVTPGDNALEQVYDATLTPWNAVSVRVQATIPARALGEVLPATTDPEADTLMLVTVHCPRTKLRYGVQLTPQGVGRWAGSIGLRKADVAGVVRLVPRLVRRTASLGSRSADGKATKKHAIIAEAKPIQIRVDSSEVQRSGGELQVSWEDFRASTNSWRRDHSNDVYAMDFNGAQPILWLNARYSKLREVYHNKAADGPEAILRPLLLQVVSQGVLHQLFVAAMSSVTSQGDGEGNALPQDWRGQLLRRLLSRMYPNSSETHGVEQLLEGWSSEGAGYVATLLGSAIQGDQGLHQDVERAIRAAERDSFADHEE